MDVVAGKKPGAPSLSDQALNGEELDPDLELLVPDDDVAHPELSIVIPALNEERTISDFLAMSREGIQRAGIEAEIVIVDSSDDRTGPLALDAGARVLRAPRRGLGRAYIDSLPYIRGRFVLMGDADCTYDFRELGPFVEKLREGNEFVMGSRFKGYIEPGSMPALHRYLGTPVTTWILNRLFSSQFSDIHCGMRGMTKDALLRMRLTSQSWEYASEMVLKAVRLKLRIAEVPVRFLKDREGRLSHHKRSGWFSPWRAAWINLRAMFVHGAEFFLLKPGLVMMAVGLAVTLPISFGPISIGSLTLSLYTMLIGVTLTLVGLQSFFLGCLAQVLHDYDGDACRRWLRFFPYTRSVLTSAALFVLGAIPVGALVVRFVREGWRLPPIASLHHTAVTGFLLMTAAFMIFAFTLLLHSATMARREVARGT